MLQAEAAARNAAWHQQQRDAASLQQEQRRLRERRQQHVMQQAQQKQLERVHKHQQREETRAMDARVLTPTLTSSTPPHTYRQQLPPLLPR